jgi:hypothetical protein
MLLTETISWSWHVFADASELSETATAWTNGPQHPMPSHGMPWHLMAITPRDLGINALVPLQHAEEALMYEPGRRMHRHQVQIMQ